MTTDYRAELQRLVTAYDDHGGKWPENHVEALCQAVERARAFLDQGELEGPTEEGINDLSPAQPEPEGPTDEELHDLWLELYGFPLFFRLH